MARSIASTDALEAIKWAALAAMLIEHVAHFAFGMRSGWPFIVGRAAFPLFSLALAVGLAGKTIEEQWRAARRLGCWGLAAGFLVALVKEPAPLNVLFTFALGVGLDAWWRGARGYKLAVTVAALPLAFAVEYGPLGVAAVALLAAWARSQTWRAGWKFAASVAFVALVPGNALSLLWWPLALVIGRLFPNLPRGRRLFYWAYAGQWPLLAALRAAL